MRMYVYMCVCACMCISIYACACVCINARVSKQTGHPNVTHNNRKKTAHLTKMTLIYTLHGYVSLCVCTGIYERQIHIYEYVQVYICI